MNISELRQKIHDFFISKDHKYIPSVSLKPDGNSTLLFTNSGMFPLVPYLSGNTHPLGKRLYNIQRCLRVEDIEDVGDRRHTTMFEMIGNWSLGDYFKEEQLNQIIAEFCIDTLGIDINRLYTSVFCGNKYSKRDETSILVLKNIYKKYNIDAEIYPKDIFDDTSIDSEIDFSKYKIFAYPEKKNWWQRGDAVGELGGPDSELFYDTGMSHDARFGKYCHPNCDCGRFIEIGNSVFMQYVKEANGWNELYQKNVDFGGGLERILMATQGSSSIFTTDLYMKAIGYLEEKTGKKYMENAEDDVCFEVISDHVKAAVFVIADDMLPSNKEQGYVLRRLIRRAIRYGRKLNLYNDFILDIAEIFIDVYEGDYIHFHKDIILQVLQKEESKFQHTLDIGLKEFEKMLQKHDSSVISGEKVFYFFETYGFPYEMYIEELQKNNIPYNKDILMQEFIDAKNKHADLSRTTSAGMFKGGLADSSEQTTKYHTVTHLLLVALRKVLHGDITQKGSNINADRMRFDFNYNEKLTDIQIREIENLINDVIEKHINIEKQEMSYKDAIVQGAIGIYQPSSDDEIVSVYKIGDFSFEICGGPHVSNTFEIGHFRIIKEESVGTGIRRIKAVLE